MPQVPSPELHELVYDLDLMAPACVLLQAAMGCGGCPAFHHFDSTHWLVAPTPGMRLLRATDEQWALVAERTRQRWGKRRPILD